MSKRAFKNKHDTDSETIDRIEQSQLAHSDNGIFVEKFLDDKPRDFTKGLDKVADGDRLYSDSSPKIQPEMQRYSKDIPINEGDYRKNLGNRQK